MLSQPIRARRLPPSRTHANRSYDLVPGSHELADWVLTIRQGSPHRKNFTCDSYAVQPVPEPGPGVTAFILAKDNDDAEVYQVAFVRGGAAYCTCTGANTKNPCKHRDALFDALFVCGLPDRGKAS